VRYDKVPLEKVANSERTFNKNWITNNGRDVSDEFVRYAQPLLGEDMISIPMIAGRQRLARLKPIFAAKKLKEFMPMGWRK
jgi:6-phosphofructokinase 1